MKKILALLVILLISLSGCGTKESAVDYATLNPQNDTYYELFVRSFADSNGDGIGDLNGVTEHLDYLKDLGVTGIWLMPINEGPSYHGYSITDYYGIESDYGTMDDFQNLIDTAKSKGITIMMDMVLNHSSDQHPWYLDAKNDINSPYRDYYYWATSTTAYSSFLGGMVDFDLSKDATKQEMKNIFDFYLEMGVRGFRLDAAMKFFQKPGIKSVTWKNTQFVMEMNGYIKTNYPDSFMTLEVWETNYELNLDYLLGSDSILDFTVQSIIQNRIGSGGSTYLLASSLQETFDAYRGVKADFVATPFITNHDMDRIASMNGFNGADGLARMKLAASTLLTLPGSPIIYYGDEIGMKGVRYEGTNIPGYGVVYDEYRRSPFIWGGSPDYETTWLPSDGSNDTLVGALDQLNDPNSLASHYKTMIALRNANPALAYGNYFEAFNQNSGALQGYVRYYELDGYKQAVLVVHNLATTSKVLDVAYEKILFGSLELGAFQTVILQIDPALIGDYI